MHRLTDHTCQLKWFVALVSALVAGVVYVGSMPPSITIESGAYVTASFDFGVPATPGYPLWTLCGFLWTHYIFPFGNPAWRLGMMSVTAGALLFGFDRAVWSCACVPEPPALYNLLYFLAVASFLGWIREPNRRRYLCATIVCLSLTEATANLNDWQVWTIMALPFIVGLFGMGIDAARASVKNQPGKP